MQTATDEWNIQGICVCNYNDCVTSNYLNYLHRLWQSKQINRIAFDDQFAVTDAACVCVCPTETGSISTVVFPILSPGCSWFPLRNKNLPIKM